MNINNKKLQTQEESFVCVVAKKNDAWKEYPKKFLKRRKLLFDDVADASKYTSISASFHSLALLGRKH